MMRLLLACFIFFAAAVSAQVLDGKDCRGVDISTSKYCAGFSKNLLAPTNFTSIMFTLFTKNTSYSNDFSFVNDLGSLNIQSASEFDSKIIEGVVLKRLGDINSIWFRCRFDQRGVLFSMSWYCNTLLNPANSACLRSGAASQPSLCRKTTDDAFASATTNFDRDSSCEGISATTFQSDIRQMQTFYDTFATTSSSDSACVSGTSAEGARGLCGYPTTQTACANSCATVPGGCGGSKTTDTIFIVVGVVLGVAVFGLIGFFVWRRFSSRRSSAVDVARKIDNESVIFTNSPYILTSKFDSPKNLPTSRRYPLSVAETLVESNGADEPFTGLKLPPLKQPNTTDVLKLPLSPIKLTESALLGPVKDLVLPTRPLRFKQFDDLSTIIPDDSASNLGVNPKYNPRKPPTRPTSRTFEKNIEKKRTTTLAIDVTIPEDEPERLSLYQPSLLMRASSISATDKTITAAILPTLPAEGTVMLSNGQDTAHMAFHTYVAKLDDELDLEPGNLVFIKAVFSDEWATGCKVDEFGNILEDQSGVFPIVALRVDPTSRT